MTVGTERPYRMVTVGAAFTANKGAASMLQAVIDAVTDRVGPTSFVVLSTYPAEDKAALRTARPAADHVRIESLRPRELVFPVLPLCLLVWLLRKIGVGGRAVAERHRVVRALSEADLVLDLAGVSFVDGRGIPILTYNVLMTSIGLLAGTPVIKCSQALGPFSQRLNRLAATAVLPRLEAVIARGDRTRQHLSDIALTNAHEAADCAFMLEVRPEDDERARDLLKSVGISEPFISVVPSEVVNGYCRARSIDYPAILAAACCRIAAQHGRPVLLLAHSARPGHGPGRMNDLPLVAELGDRLSDTPGVTALTEDVEPAVLRSIIGASELCVTSRFHAMISALERCVPTLVVGWSHKYAEVLRDLGLEEWALSYDDIEADLVSQRVGDLTVAAAGIRERLDARLPRVIERARQNLDVIEAALPSRESD